MTLDEAIQHAREVTQSGCSECCKEHEQLAEWLEELRDRRHGSTKKAYWEPSEDGEYHCTNCGAVYTRIPMIVDNEVITKECMIMNVQSTSCGGAEHVILDIHSTITNALAFDMENPVDMMSYMAHCKCFDIRDFRARYAKLIEARQAVIDEQYDEIDDWKHEICEKKAEIARLEAMIRNLKKDVERINGDIDWAEGEIADYCRKTGMRNERSEEEPVLGIA